MRVLHFIDENIETFISSLLLITISFVTVLQIVMRYVFSSPLVWTEEIARFAFVWFVYISAGYAVKYQRHVKFSFIVESFKKPIRIIAQLIAFLFWLAFLVVVFYLSIDLIIHLKQTMQKSAANQIPMYIVYLAIPIGSLLMTIRVIQHTVKHIVVVKRYFTEGN